VQTLATGAHVLWRAKADTDLPVLKVLPDGTYLSRIADPEGRCQMVCVKPEPDFRSITDSWLLNWDIRWA
jgi:hypothetical protein